MSLGVAPRSPLGARAAFLYLNDSGGPQSIFGSVLPIFAGKDEFRLHRLPDERPFRTGDRLDLCPPADVFLPLWPRVRERNVKVIPPAKYVKAMTPVLR